ncbi:hypothetical protein B0T25DRAFT_618525 [Lasiosphaeria hispida]|uniref:NAD(P)-binding domain-containing protein n=1 Tax=Lasiosphaeria hispida TaxID=260671 RepID=A0AAJ0M7U3_9PEZI|nr:hypothetical protein B0T25DRAFT_618525 [Lasiosphaeria hispida]
MTQNTKIILFLGATGGCGLSVLRRSLAAGHTCIALCRTPSTLLTKLDTPNPPPNLVLHTGNAHDPSAVFLALTAPVDTILTSIGGVFTFTGLTIDDPHVCETGMATLLAAIRRRRAEVGPAWRPRLLVISSTGHTGVGPRDTPLLMVPLYRGLLAVPRRDKKAMEDLLVGEGAEEGWTVVRPSLLTDGGSGRVVRVGVEDPGGRRVERSEVGYTISREDVGKWVFEELIEEREPGRWLRKAVGLTY